MKKTFLILMLFVSSISIAQDFTLLGVDAEGDPTVSGISDLRAISYAIDESADSLWFKIDLHTSLPGDLGIVFGIDTDLVPENGLNWNSSGNMDLLPEVVFTVNRNFIQPDLLYGFSNNNLNHTSTFGENDSTIIVNMKLSNLDADGKFNLILGASTFDSDVNNRTIYDDLPDTGFFLVDNTTTSVLEIPESSSYRIYPNPARDHLYLESIDKQSIAMVQIYSSNGQLIEEVSNNEEPIQKIDCEDLKGGIYFLSIWDNNGFNSTARFLKL